MSLISDELKKVLVCPLDKGALEENNAATSLRCTVCGKTYQVKDSIPIMLVEQKNDRKDGNAEKRGGIKDGRRR